MKNKNKWIYRKFCIFLFIFVKLQTFVAVCKIWVVKAIVPVVEGLNIISLYTFYELVTGPKQPIYVVLCVQNNFQNALPSDFWTLAH